MGTFCVEHYEDEHDLIWELIWTNFAYGSTLVNWFINTIKPGQTFSKPMLDELALNEFEGARTSITYAIGGFMQIFNYSPIGEILRQGNSSDGKIYLRSAFTDLSETAIAYSLYKYAEERGTRYLRIADFYQDTCQSGPAKEFGIEKSTFEKLLRQLNSASNRLLVAELNMGQDSITLRDDLSSIAVLNMMVL